MRKASDIWIYLLPIWIKLLKKQFIINIIYHNNATQSWSHLSSFQYAFFYKVNIKVFGGEPGPAATLAPKLGPLGLVNNWLFRTLKKSDKILSKKEENGKEFE